LVAAGDQTPTYTWMNESLQAAKPTTIWMNESPQMASRPEGLALENGENKSLSDIYYIENAYGLFFLTKPVTIGRESRIH